MKARRLCFHVYLLIKICDDFLGARAVEHLSMGNGNSVVCGYCRQLIGRWCNIGADVQGTFEIDNRSLGGINGKLQWQGREFFRL